MSNLVQCSKAISALSPSTSLLASAARPLITQLSLFISCHNTRCVKNKSLKTQVKEVSCFSAARVFTMGKATALSFTMMNKRRCGHINFSSMSSANSLCAGGLIKIIINSALGGT